MANQTEIIDKANYRCAIYGPSGAFGKPDFEDKMDQIKSAIHDLISNGITTFITSANDGFELDAAVYIKELKEDEANLHLVIVRPYPGKVTNWHTAPILRSVEKAADMVKQISDSESTYRQIEMDKWITSHCNTIIYTYGGQKPCLNRLSKIDLSDKNIIYIPTLKVIETPEPLEYPKNILKDLFDADELDKRVFEIFSEEKLNSIIDDRLTDREAIIIQARYVDNKTLQAIGEDIGVTRERIRQIIKKANRKIKYRIKRELRAIYTSDSNLEKFNNSDTDSSLSYVDVTTGEIIDVDDSEKPIPGVNIGARWTDKEEDLLAARFSSGLSIREIAELHGRNSGGIRARLKRMGLISDDDEEISNYNERHIVISGDADKIEEYISKAKDYDIVTKPEEQNGDAHNT